MWRQRIYPCIYILQMGSGRSFSSKMNYTLVGVVVPNTCTSKAAQLPSIIKKRTVRSHRMTNKDLNQLKTIPDITIQCHKQGSPQTLNKTQLLPKTWTARTKQKPTTTKSGRNRTHSPTQEHKNTDQQPNNTTKDKNDMGWMKTEQAHPQTHKR